MRDAIIKLLQEKWAVVCLFVLLIILGCVHGFMIHYNRPETTINWCEGMITGTFSALLMKLKD